MPISYIERALAMAEKSHNYNQERPWALINLPPFPGVALKVLQLLSTERDDMGLKELSTQIQADPALSCEILTIANSALFGFRTEVRTILQAAVLLGKERVKGIALTIAMKTYLTKSFQVPALFACWRHSLACALAAEEIAAAGMIERDFAYLAGLLHDVGRLALGMIKPVEYADLLATATSEEIRKAERDLFGVDHCEAGRWLTEAWKLPKPFIDCAASHHTPPGARSDLVAVINRACRVADALGFDAVPSKTPQDFDQIIGSLPERDRRRFRHTAESLGLAIRAKIQSLE